ncbi:exported hypothetical protein [Verrucomicrobia bacterium]|nr:exported hypothetical protein [Verrucomicrobiota bacterium]
MKPFTRISSTRPFLLAFLFCLPWAAQSTPTNNVVLAAHSQDLVVVQDGQFVSFKSKTYFSAPYTVLYFGAGWCPDCRRFSPALVEAYDRQPPAHRRFEVLLLTMDQSAGDLRKFMQNEKMKWPAVEFEKVAQAADLKKYYSGHGIPCLTVIGPDGSVVLQSKDDQDAKEILKELENFVAKEPSKAK